MIESSLFDLVAGAVLGALVGILVIFLGVKFK